MRIALLLACTLVAGDLRQRVVATYSLTSGRKALRIYARVLFRPVAMDIGDVAVEFYGTRYGHRINVHRFGVNTSNRRGVTTEAHDFIGLGHKQLFVGIDWQHAGAFILDFDGHRIRRIYSNEVGRVTTRPRLTRHGWRLVELYPVQQWGDDDDMGTGHLVPANMVERVLRWNGSQFVNVRPGPTRLVGSAPQSNH